MTLNCQCFCDHSVGKHELDGRCCQGVKIWMFYVSNDWLGSTCSRTITIWIKDIFCFPHKFSQRILSKCTVVVPYVAVQFIEWNTTKKKRWVRFFAFSWSVAQKIFISQNRTFLASSSICRRVKSPLMWFFVSLQTFSSIDIANKDIFKTKFSWFIPCTVTRIGYNIPPNCTLQCIRMYISIFRYRCTDLH